jgi:hypothetical protein
VQKKPAMRQDSVRADIWLLAPREKTSLVLYLFPFAGRFRCKGPDMDVVRTDTPA